MTVSSEALDLAGPAVFSDALGLAGPALKTLLSESLDLAGPALKTKGGGRFFGLVSLDRDKLSCHS